MLQLHSNFKPTGDQPKAIKDMLKNIKTGVKDQVLLGVTGSGKTFSIANVIEKTQKPTLIISHNKTLAAQLYQEFKDFFPNNAVHYFVSYYDYYQPEAYIPQSDTYIEKDAKINQEIDRLRHSAVQDTLVRDDIIIVASVSCIYNIGDPKNYKKVSLDIVNGQDISRKDLILHLVNLQYQRNDYDFTPGVFRVRGDSIEINLVTGEKIIKVEFFGNKIEELYCNKEKINKIKLFPATFWTSTEHEMKIAIENIKSELQEHLAVLKKQNKLLEMQRLAQRTNYDIEMLESTGACKGVENYSKHLDFREPGEAPFTLMDYFPKNFLCVIDESHMTIPQLNAMYNTDKARKIKLVEYGFRLPSCMDNRPLNFEEFKQKKGKTIYASATPALYEMEISKNHIVEQIIRPTGLLEPTIEIKPIENQVADLITEIKKRIPKNQRTLAITLTKRMAEELSTYLENEGIKATYLHSDIKTLERPAILKKFRQGEFDVLVGINLLREGLDLPEVALIGILDADKEGFLRNKTTLIQTMGRAARHIEGHIILYADKLTLSIKSAIEEIKRRKKIQKAYNKKHKITPQPIIKDIKDWSFGQKEEQIEAEFMVIKDIKLLEKEMKKAASNLDFERAAELRDLIKKLK